MLLGGKTRISSFVQQQKENWKDFLTTKSAAPLHWSAHTNCVQCKSFWRFASLSRYSTQFLLSNQVNDPVDENHELERWPITNGPSIRTENWKEISYRLEYPSLGWKCLMVWWLLNRVGMPSQWRCESVTGVTHSQFNAMRIQVCAIFCTCNCTVQCTHNSSHESL